MAEPLLKREVCPVFDYHAVRALRRQIMENYIDENGVEPKPGLLPMIRDLQRMRMRVALATATLKCGPANTCAWSAWKTRLTR